MPAKDISQIVERALGALCLFSHVRWTREHAQLQFLSSSKGFESL